MRDRRGQARAARKVPFNLVREQAAEDPAGDSSLDRQKMHQISTSPASASGVFCVSGTSIISNSIPPTQFAIRL